MRIRALAAACVAAAATLFAQDPPKPAPPVREQPFLDWRAPDGSRFVLIPDRAGYRAPVVHWVTLVPTDPADEPSGAEGLARAIVRASLDGSGGSGSLDSARESEALDRLDDLERRILAARRRGEQPPETELRTTRAATAALGVPDAWRRSLARSGATDVELREIDGASLIHVASPTESLREVALLVRERREAPLLRDLRRTFDTVRAEFRVAADSPGGRLQRDLLGAAFPGIAAARPISEHPRLWTRSEALALFGAVHHPTRGLHVLTGGFDAQRVRELLAAVFTDTRLPPTAAPPPPAPSEARARRAVIPSTDAQAIAFAWPQPAGSPEIVLAAAEWLAGGRMSRIAAGLRGAGLGEVEVSYRVPFPVQARPGVLVVQVIAEAANPRNAELEKLVAELLLNAATTGPSGAELARLRSRASNRASSWSIGTRDAGFVVAEHAGLHGRDVATLFLEFVPPESDALKTIAAQLERAPRTVVALQVTR